MFQWNVHKHYLARCNNEKKKNDTELSILRTVTIPANFIYNSVEKRIKSSKHTESNGHIHKSETALLVLYMFHVYYIVEQFLCVGLSRTTMMFVSFFCTLMN